MVPMASSPQWDDCFGYNARWGYVKDATGLYYCQNRYYDPANGRWLTRDPIGYEGGINLYGYCGGGPVGAADPWGLMGISDKPGVVALSAGDEAAADAFLARLGGQAIDAAELLTSPGGRAALGICLLYTSPSPRD